MKISRNTIRLMAVMALSGLALLFLAGCIGVTFEWKGRALQIVHTQGFSGTPENDTQADIVRYGDKSYIVFTCSDGTDFQICLQDTDQFAGQSIHTLKQLTTAAEDHVQPRITASGGYLYVVYARFDSGTDYNIYWIKVNTSTLGIVDGPVQVSTLAAQHGASRDDTVPRIVHTSGRTDIVWLGQPTSNLTNTIFWNSVTDAGVADTPVYVSNGAPGGCQATIVTYDQYNPRITRSAGGTWSYVAWYGGSGSGNLDAYWRAITNTTGVPATGCVNYTTLDSGQDHQDVELSTNSANRSFLAWERYDSIGTDYDVQFGSIGNTGTECDKRTIGTGVDDNNPDVAAGDVVSDWVHLVWDNHFGSSDVWYNTYDASACLSTPFSVNTGGDAAGIITLTVSPFPIGDVAGEPHIGVATGADILDTSVQGSASLEAQQSYIQRLVENGTLSKSEADALLADGRITAEELEPLWQMRAARAAARAEASRLHLNDVQSDSPEDASTASIPDGPVVTHAPLDPAAEANFNAMDQAAFEQECADDPALDICQNADSKAARLSSPAAPSACAAGAQDAVAVAWLSDLANDRLYADEIASGQYLSACGFLIDNGPVQIGRVDGTQDDDTPTRVLVTNHGVAHVVYNGFALHGLSQDDEDIFYVATHIPSYLPLILQNYP